MEAPRAPSIARLLRDFAGPGERHRYGPGRFQVGELRLPTGDGPFPVVVVLHGGYWKARYSRRITRPAAADLARRGWASWNLEYRRLGRGQRGGWPATFDDVAAGIDALARLGSERLDLGHVVVLGHSAGGHLALWAAGRRRVPTGAPGADPKVRATAVAALAAVSDLEAAPSLMRPGEPVAELLGGDAATFPERYEQANPRRLLPFGIPVLLVHGPDDETVPVRRSREFAAAARAAGDQVDLIEPPETGHSAVVDPRTAAWDAACWLDELTGANRSGPGSARTPEAPAWPARRSRRRTRRP